jgi:pimeloyl-ACP methyl ester carboxylesterase
VSPLSVSGGHHTALHVVRHHSDREGPPVVLVHGAPDRSKNFAHVVHQLQDLPVTVYDRRGYGKSIEAATAPDGATIGGFGVHADDLIDLLDGKPSIVVGQSAGASIALLASTRAPELFLALGAWEPPMVPWTWWMGDLAYKRTKEWADHPEPAALAEEFNRSILGDERWDGLRATTREMLRSEGAAFRADMASQGAPYFELASLSVPIVVGCGTEADEELFRQHPHQRLADRIGAQLFIAEGADHFAHTNYPDAWVELVRRTVALAEGSATPPGAGDDLSG